MTTRAESRHLGELGTRRLGGFGSGNADDVAARRPGAREDSEPTRISPAAAGFVSRWDLVLFCLGLLGIAFAYGIAVGKYRVFPHTELARAADALKDWRQNWRHYLGLRSRYLLPTARTTGGVTVLDARAASPGYTFLTMYRDGRYGASLLDLDGRTLHTWDVAFSDAFPQPEHLEVVPPDTDVSVHGAELLPNGDLILSFGMLGAARIDRCSQVSWTVPGATHHALDHLEDGSTLVLASRQYDEDSSPFPRLQPGPAGYLWDDTLLTVRPDGSLAEERSVLQILYDSGWQAMMFVGSGGTVIRDHDPLHTNDVEVLREDMAAAFPQFEAGDVMLSLRNINSVIVVDGDTWRIKWKMTGPFLMQHDPDFLPNGNIMVFDNRITGARPEFGYSQILEIDPVTREVVWSYQGTDAKPFYTDHGGVQQMLPNGNVLVVETQGGRVFEVTREPSARIVWEYVNLQEAGFVGSISGARRIAADDLDFIGRSCAGSARG